MFPWLDYSERTLKIVAISASGMLPLVTSRTLQHISVMLPGNYDCGDDDASNYIFRNIGATQPVVNNYSNIWL